MNLSFSTRGWLDVSWEENIQTALDMRFGGIEVYNIHKTPALTDRGGPFHKYNTAATVRQLREKKLTIPVFDTSCDISSEDCLDDVLRLCKDQSMSIVNLEIQSLPREDAADYSALVTLRGSTRSETMLEKIRRMPGITSAMTL